MSNHRLPSPECARVRRNVYANEREYQEIDQFIENELGLTFSEGVREGMKLLARLWRQRLDTQEKMAHIAKIKLSELRKS